MEINPFSHQGVPKSVIDATPAPGTPPPTPDRWGLYVTLHIGLAVVEAAGVLLVFAIGAALDLFLNSGSNGGAPTSPSTPTPLSIIDVVLRAELLAVPVFTLYAIIVPLVRRRMDWVSLAGSFGIIAALLAYALTSQMISFVLFIILVYVSLGLLPFVRAALEASGGPKPPGRD